MSEQKEYVGESGRCKLVDSVVEKEKRRKVTKLRLAVTSAILLTVGTLWAFLLIGQLKPFKVVSRSMCPTLAVGDCILVNSNLSPYERLTGNIIAFTDTTAGATGAKEDLVKRCIAEGGDRVTVDNHVICVNQIPENRNVDKIVYLHGDWKVGKDELFVAGDNRNNSYDSFDYGPISRSRLIGKVVFRYWPMNRIGWPR